MTEVSWRDLILALETVIYLDEGNLQRRIAPLPPSFSRNFAALEPEQIDLTEPFPFLESFLPEAREFWRQGGETLLRSGPWVEQTDHGRDCPLEALAVRTPHPLLLIQFPGSVYTEHQRLLQAARNKNLLYEQLLGAQRELRESERRFRDLADGVPVLIWMTNPDRECTFLNKTWYEFTGQVPVANSHSALQRAWIDPMDGHELPKSELRGELEERLRGRRRFQCELLLRRYDGERRWLLNTALPRFAPGGRFAGFIGSCVDITDRKKLADELEDSNRSLREKAQQSTAELVATQSRLQQEVNERRHSNELLLRNQKELRRLAQALTQAEEAERLRIATGLHDQLGQSLAAAKMKLGLLGADLAREKQRSVDEIRALLDETIRFTRSLTFELGSPLLYEFGLGAALEQLAESESRSQGIPIRFSRKGEAPELPHEIAVLLFRGTRELLHNVRKHAHASRVRLHLAWSEGVVDIWVEDNGQGFEPDTNTSTPQGGFGLYNLRERLEHNGGDLVIDSQPRAGCSAHMRLPLSSSPLTGSGVGSTTTRQGVSGEEQQ